jgi:hypothetical protein
MRSILLIGGAALALSACGNNNESSDANTLTADNVLVDDSATANAMLEGDLNAVSGANGAMDANTANAVAQDLNTNDPDTNLANGL